MLYRARKYGICETGESTRGIVLAICERSRLCHATFVRIGFLECAASVVESAKLDRDTGSNTD